MFEQALAVEYGRTNRTWTTMAGFAGEALVLGIAVLMPLLSPERLPQTQALMQIFLPQAPVAPPPPAPVALVSAQQVARPALQLRDGVLRAPSAIPPKPVILDEPPLTAAELGGGTGVPGGIEGGLPGGVLHGLPAEVVRQVPPLAPIAAATTQAPAPPKPAEPVRIKVGGNVQHARLIKQVIPVYPILARQARISGNVQLVGLIGTDGRIRQLQYVSGHPLLTPAALDAVRQWIYRPTYLNGDPVEVIAPITVSFVLN
jgi:protein TonB